MISKIESDKIPVAVKGNGGQVFMAEPTDFVRVVSGNGMSLKFGC
jgi:hypothetical protein